MVHDRQHDDSYHAWLYSLLPSYATAVVLGRKAHSRFSELVQHLEKCNECQGQLEQVLGMLTPLYEGTLPRTEQVHALDLSFLDGSTSSDLHRQAQPDIQAVFALQTGLFEGLQLNLGKQLDELRSYWNNGYRKPALFQARGFILVNYEPDPKLTAGSSVSVQILRNDNNPERCDLKLTMMLPDELDAQNGIQAVLRVDDQRWEQTGDAWDSFLFPAVLSPQSSTLSLSAMIVP